MTTPRVTSIEWMRWSVRIADLSASRGMWAESVHSICLFNSACLFPRSRNCASKPFSHIGHQTLSSEAAATAHQHRTPTPFRRWPSMCHTSVGTVGSEFWTHPYQTGAKPLDNPSRKHRQGSNLLGGARGHAVGRVHPFSLEQWWAQMHPHWREVRLPPDRAVGNGLELGCGDCLKGRRQ
jgi:hypothetical protein